MDTETRNRLLEIFTAASTLKAEERAVFLADACAENDTLRREVESLLAYAQLEGSFLAKPAAQLYAKELVEGPQVHLTGQQFGQYLIQEEIGKGGMGQVYKARDQKLARDVAIKILPLEFTANEDRVRRFEQEAQTISVLNHPNILTIHEIGQHNHLRFMVTELVAGKTLREKIVAQTGKPFQWREVVRLGLQIAEALNAAHTAGIIHRDIKPENIMMQANGHVKVLDFGIAKRGVNVAGSEVQYDKTQQGEQTVAGIITGTVNYMSPEQRRGESLDHRTDIFSFGVVLYELLAGHRPYDGLRVEERDAALLSAEEIPPLRKSNAMVPAALETIVANALRKNKDSRCSIQEMIDDLRELKSFIDVSEQKEGQAQLRARNANRLLTQFVTLYTADVKKRASLNVLWTIWRHANLKFGFLENEVLRKSWRSVLATSTKWSLVILSVAAVVGIAIARVMSIEPVWEEHIIRDGHSKWVHSIAFSPDGRLLVSASEDNTVMVWDFARRMRLKTLTDHTARVNAVAFSPDGKWFATGSNDKTVIVWDAVKLGKVTTLQEHRDAVNAVAFSPDGKWFASASSADSPAGSDFRAVLWDTSRWKKSGEVGSGVVYGPILFSPDSRLLIIGGMQWDLVSGEKIALGESLPPEKRWGGWNWAALSPDAKMLVSTGGGGEVIFREMQHPGEVASSTLRQQTRPHQDFGRAVAFSPDGKLVATGTDVILLWDATTKKIVSRFDEVSSVWSLAFSPDGRWLVSAHKDGAVQVRDINDRRGTVGFDGHGDQVRVVAASSNGKLASAAKDGTVILWNADTEQKETVFFGHETQVVNLAFSPDAKWLYSFDQDGFIARWDVTNHVLQWKEKSHSGGDCLTVSPDGRFLTNPWAIIDSSTGKDLIRWDEMKAGIQMVDVAEFSPDGKRVVVVSETTMRILETQTWKLLYELKTPSAITQIRFINGGVNFITGFVDGTLTWWETEKLQKLAEVKEHKSAISIVALSPDGKTIASADKDAILIWDANRQKKLATIGPQPVPVYSLAFSQDGKRLFAGKRDRSVRVYTHHLVRWGKRLE